MSGFLHQALLSFADQVAKGLGMLHDDASGRVADVRVGVATTIGRRPAAAIVRPPRSRAGRHLNRAGRAAPATLCARPHAPPIGRSYSSIQTRSWLSGSSIGEEMNSTWGASSNRPPWGVLAGITHTSPFLTGRVTPPTVTEPVPSST